MYLVIATLLMPECGEDIELGDLDPKTCLADGKFAEI